MEKLLIVFAITLIYSCNSSKDNNKPLSTSEISTINLDSATELRIKEPKASAVDIFGLRIYLDSVNKYVDTIPTFLTDICFDCRFNLSGKVMAHGSDINPSARYEILNQMNDPKLLEKIREALAQMPNSGDKPIDHWAQCRNTFDSIQYSDKSILELVDSRISELKHR